jgi:hypothetical protein
MEITHGDILTILGMKVATHIAGDILFSKSKVL